MKTCRNCVYYLAHRVNGYNCGYLIKRVGSCNVICRHFDDTESYRMESREGYTLQKEERFISWVEEYAEKSDRVSRTSLHPDFSRSKFLGCRFSRIKELLDRYRDTNRKAHVWLKGIFEGRKKGSGTCRRWERRN